MWVNNPILALEITMGCQKETVYAFSRANPNMVRNVAMYRLCG